MSTFYGQALYKPTQMALDAVWASGLGETKTRTKRRIATGGGQTCNKKKYPCRFQDQFSNHKATKARYYVVGWTELGPLRDQPLVELGTNPSFCENVLS
ncbi:Zinc finger protein 333 [Plakobranchus ocellatus]|uniref:Zinc finger protein 333 n=1 Tax=Plakobranchus ocellatus TaxID=259542 RepID=A0AAV4DI94_9GAST|nr:Zinc finger protein 333 [Plakobranchus ocellatus]